MKGHGWVPIQTPTPHQCIKGTKEGSEVYL